jgi:hypothetical protein
MTLGETIIASRSLVARNKSERDMTDRQEQRGEQRIDERDPKREPEPQEGARRNTAQSVDNKGRDAKRDGSDSDA